MIQSKHRRLILFAIITMLLVFAGCTRPPRDEKAISQLSLGMSRSVNGTLAIVAQELGFFEKEGLEVDLKVYLDGTTIVSQLRNGELDTAVVVEGVIASEAFSNENLRIVATVAASDDDSRVLARKDSGVQTAEDLAGKKIGVYYGSSTHFFFYMFLLKHGLTENDVEIIYETRQSLIEGFGLGEFDAVALFGPYRAQAIEAAGGEVVVLSEPGLHNKLFNLISTENYIKAEPDVIEKLLSALIKAEAYTAEKPVEAMQITASYLDYSAAEMETSWNAFTYKVYLDQALLMTYENIAEWMIRIGLQEGQQIPDFYELLYPDALLEVAPDRVNLIR